MLLSTNLAKYVLSIIKVSHRLGREFFLNQLDICYNYRELLHNKLDTCYNQLNQLESGFLLF